MNPPANDAIETEALAWLAERDEGFVPARAAAFEEWRRRDPRHAAAVAELEQVLAQLEGLAERRGEVNARFDRVSPPRPSVAPVPTTATSISGRWWRPVLWGGAAAALALAAFLGFRATPPGDVPERRYVTSAAGYERTRLDDGSTLELNASSAARVRFTAAERRVELQSGEANFEVAHDATRPFVVSAGGVALRAVGTAFNVRLAAGAVEVTVTEGKIQVERVESGARSGGANAGFSLQGQLAPFQGIAVAAEERLVMPFASGSVAAPTPERLAPAALRAVIAWQRRVTDFFDTPLAEAVARFNRHNAVQLVVTDPALGARRIGGMFALDDVEAFVRLLERDGIFRAQRVGNTVELRTP